VRAACANSGCTGGSRGSLLVRGPLRGTGKRVRTVLAPLVILSLTATVFRVTAASRHNPVVAQRTSGSNWATHVDPFIGTSGDGNVTPAASAPFGMVQWGPDTSAGGLSKPGGYNYGDTIIRDFSLTHLSGAGCAAFGNFPMMPTTLPIRQVPQANGSPYSARFLHSQEHASPGQYGVHLASAIDVHLATTMRAGEATFRFPSHTRASLIVDTGGGSGIANTSGMLTSRVAIVGNRALSGSATGGNFCGLRNKYTIYFAAEFDHPFQIYGTWHSGTLFRGSRRSQGHRAGAWVTFNLGTQRTVRMRIGLSYVSTRAARANLRAEMPTWNLSRVEDQTRKRWNTVLGRIETTGASSRDTVRFYSALYRCFLHPNVFSDVDGRYIGFDGRVHLAHAHTQYANFSGWDIYRSWVQLVAWLLPHEVSDMMQSLVTDAREGGFLPKWPVANQDTGEMNGDSSDPILAGAWAFGARSFDARTALQEMKRGATVPGVGPRAAPERPGLADYLRLGYVRPQNGGWGAAATTLEYTVDDFAIAQLARNLHDTWDYRTFLHRSRNWQRLYNSRSGFMQQRLSNGTFDPAFTPTSMDGFVEGDAYQYLWMAPQDLPGLFHTLGPDPVVRRRLHDLFTRLEAGPVARYYWAGNEPGLEIPWEYDWTRSPWRTQDVVSRIMREEYPASTRGLPGNDDLGAMSSWYVWSALGMYPEIPGVGGFALARPHFTSVTIQWAHDKELQVQSPQVGASPSYTQVAFLDGKQLTRPWVSLSDLHPQSTLRFVPGKSRITWPASHNIHMP